MQSSFHSTQANLMQSCAAVQFSRGWATYGHMRSMQRYITQGSNDGGYARELSVDREKQVQ